MQKIRSDHRYISATCTLSQGEFHTAHNNYTQCVLEYLLCNRSKDTKNYLRLLTRDCNKKLNFIYFRPRNVREHPKPTRFFSGISKRKLEIYSRFFFYFTEDISHDDLIIDVDNSFARQLYKKWEKSIQVDIFLL